MTLAIDFDGVIHAYSRGWADGTIYDPPLPGALDGLRMLMEHDAVFVFTTRDPYSVAKWLADHGFRTCIDHDGPFWNRLGVLLVTNCKLAATVYLDDRAVRFTSWDQALAALLPDHADQVPTPTRGGYALAPPVDQSDALATVTGYAVSVLPFDHPEFPDYAFFVELNPHREWVVHDGGAGFGTDGRPRVGEPYRHPLPSREEALALARRLAPGRTIGSRTATDVLRDTVAALMPRQGAAVHPLETPAGADTGTEAPEGATGAHGGTGRLRALLRNAVSTVLREESEHVPLSVRTAAGDAALARVDAWRTPASDQGARWSRREQLGVLLSRMHRGVLLDTERPLLRAAVERELTDAEIAHQELANQRETFEDAWQQQAAENARLRDERDRARRVAVELEQQVAAVAALHVHNVEADYCDLCADHGDIGWPCATIRALGPQEGQ